MDYQFAHLRNPSFLKKKQAPHFSRLSLFFWSFYTAIFRPLMPKLSPFFSHLYCLEANNIPSRNHGLFKGQKPHRKLTKGSVWNSQRFGDKFDVKQCHSILKMVLSIKNFHPLPIRGFWLDFWSVFTQHKVTVALLYRQNKKACPGACKLTGARRC